MKERLKSPIVIIQLVSLIAGGIVIFAPQFSNEIKEVTGIIVSIIQVIAGLNNPTDKENF